MKIAVNTRLVIENKLEGIGRFTFELLKRMIPAHDDVEFHLFFDRPYRGQLSQFKNVKCHVVFPPFKHVAIGPYWFDHALRRKLKKIDPDLFLSTDSMNMLKPICKTLTVIHDLNFEHAEVKLPTMVRNYYKNRVPTVAKQSNALATVSEFSRKDMAEIYDIDQKKIEVVYNAVNEGFKPVAESEHQSIREEVSKGRPYFLFVGGMYHRKNLVRLLKAFEKFKAESHSDTALVLAGNQVSEASELLNEIEGSEYRKDIFLPGRIDDNKLPLLYSAARAFTLVSVLEGFGIPVLEAMSCACPVIVADNTSLPEIAGDAGFYVDAMNVDSIADGLMKLDSDVELRQDLSQKALERSSKFNWDESAEILWNLIKKTALRWVARFSLHDQG